MKNVIEKFKAEKAAIELKKSEMQDRQSEGIEEAYQTGKRIAERWVRKASYQEFKDAVRRPNAKNDANYFSLMYSIYFTFTGKRYVPKSQSDSNGSTTMRLVNGWREEVNKIWESIRDDINQ